MCPLVTVVTVLLLCEDVRDVWPRPEYDVGNQANCLVGWGGGLDIIFDILEYTRYFHRLV